MMILYIIYSVSVISKVMKLDLSRNIFLHVLVLFFSLRITFDIVVIRGHLILSFLGDFLFVLLRIFYVEIVYHFIHMFMRIFFDIGKLSNLIQFFIDFWVLEIPFNVLNSLLFQSTLFLNAIVNVLRYFVELMESNHSIN